MKIHIVQKGDTLWKIAKKYGVSFEELKMLNSQLSNPDMIMPGMKIKVPTTGGNIKKEAPIVGAKKEMPKAEHPFVKEKPKTAPIMEYTPKKEVPKKEMPIKEMPKEKPYTPKMPTPIIPEIDINNYYSMNMTNVDVDIEIEKPLPKPKPIVKETVPVQQEVCPPIIPYQPICVSPMMPGSGFPPGVCPPVPIETEQIPGVAPTAYHHWQDESSSHPYMPHHTQHGEVGGAYNPYGSMQAMPQAGNIPHEYYQQPLVHYGQMPVEHGHDVPHPYKQESSSDYMGMMHTTPSDPMQMPYSGPAMDDCGCGGPSMPQAGHYPEHGFSPQMGAYPFPESYGAGGGMPQGQQGFAPQMGAYPFPESHGAGGGVPQGQQGFAPQMGAYPFPESHGAGGGVPQGQQGFAPQMGAYPFPESHGAGGGMPQGQQGFAPQMGAYPFPESHGAGGGMPQGQQGFAPQMGAYPFPESYDAGGGMPQGQQGFRPEMAQLLQPFVGPDGYNPMIHSPYPHGVVGNIPFPGYTPAEELHNGNVSQESFAMNQPPVPAEMTPPVFGPGGTAPVYMPPYHGNFAQPPLMNPYGVDARTPFGMPYYQDDESSDYGN
ncbi:SafA/ExsA family spore coat assembly protein [Niallia sp. 03133]|uniref:SafA/ExsA family spore coat assembly protein n=1 Tax=Niallia sp. 03133 TaxID=3458060 RepID=UPI004044EF42